MRIDQLAVRSAILTLVVVGAIAGTAGAQWLSLPLPGTPRTADGKPNLNAPAPRAADGKPDLSGIWLNENRVVNENLAPAGTDAPMMPWAAEVFKKRVATHGYDRPMTRCMPHGVPDAVTSPYPFKIVQTPSAAIVLYEEFHKYRQIHTDGRALPVDPDPAYYGSPSTIPRRTRGPGRRRRSVSCCSPTPNCSSICARTTET
jgi:hypothetical protein